MEKRTISTVAPQALYLLNDSLVSVQSAAFAKRLLAETHATPESRIASAWWHALGRAPKPKELAVAKSVVAGPGEKGWNALAQVLLCSNEFLFVD